MTDAFPGKDDRTPGLESPFQMRQVVGTGMLLLGLIFAGCLIVALFELISAQSPPGLVASISTPADEPVTIGSPGGDFTLPRAFFAAIGYLLACFVYAIAATLTGGIIKGGVSLLQPDLSHLLRRLVERIDRK